MVTERAIINFLIIGASFILVPFLVFSALTVDYHRFESYAPLLLLGGLVALAVAFFFLKETLSVWPLLCLGIAGSLNFLPLPLQATHIACILLICYYITGYVIIRLKRIKLGKTTFLWPILITTAIVLYHNHSLHLHVLGGETEGGKPAFLIYLTVVAYFCGINLAPPSVNFLSKVPLYSVIVTGLSCIPFFLTTYIPSLAPLLYSVTDTVNVEAYVNAQTSSGTGGELSRLGAFGALGEALQIYLLCHYPIGTWLRPERWWVVFLSLLCLVCVVASGYRNVLFSFALITMVATWGYYSWRSFFLPVGLFIVALIILVASNNNLIHLPENKLPIIAQRTLSFLPGDWDEEALEAAKASNDFRKNIIDVYIKEYMAKSPLIGNGFDINVEAFNNAGDALQGAGVDNGYLQAKTFIEGKLFHTGWVSVYDCVGIIGFLAFIVLAWNEMVLTAHFVFGSKSDYRYPLFQFYVRLLCNFLFGSKADRRSSLYPLYIWLLCTVFNMIVPFFTVFGDFKQTFMNLCVLGIVLSQLSDIENTTEVPIVLPERKREAEFPRLKGAYGGY